MLDSDFTSSIITHHVFAVLSSLVANSLFLLSIFKVKCHINLALGNMKVDQLQFLQEGCMTNIEGAIVDTFCKKWSHWSVIKMYSCNLHIDPKTGELAVKFVVYVITVLLGDWFCLTSLCN